MARLCPHQTGLPTSASLLGGKGSGARRGTQGSAEPCRAPALPRPPWATPPLLPGSNSEVGVHISSGGAPRDPGPSPGPGTGVGEQREASRGLVRGLRGGTVQGDPRCRGWTAAPATEAYMAPDPLPLAAPGKTSLLGDQHRSARKRASLPRLTATALGAGPGEGAAASSPAGPHVPPGAAASSSGCCRGCRRAGSRLGSCLLLPHPQEVTSSHSLQGGAGARILGSREKDGEHRAMRWGGWGAGGRGSSGVAATRGRPAAPALVRKDRSGGAGTPGWLQSQGRTQRPTAGVRHQFSTAPLGLRGGEGLRPPPSKGKTGRAGAGRSSASWQAL